MKEAKGREVALDLVRDADVVVQSMRPGKIEDLGLDYKSISKINPSAIYVSLSGYGQDGPYSGRAVYDPVLQAQCGYVSLQVNPEIPFPTLCEQQSLIKQLLGKSLYLSQQRFC